MVINMNAKFICHPDFSGVEIIDIFRKEHAPKPAYEHPAHLQNRHVLFRKKLCLKNGEKHVLKITADDYYKLYINGEFVTMGPASSYPWGFYYNEVDVSKYIKEGENTFAVHTYYQGYINHAWISGDLRAGFWCELEADGKTVLVSDESWKCADHTAYTEHGKIGYDTIVAECYDSSAAEVGFQYPSFDDSAWIAPAIRKNDDHVLVKQPSQQLEVYFYQPKTVQKTENGYFVDMGQLLAGYVYMEAKGNKGDEVLIRFAEELNEDGTVRYQMRCNCVGEEKWILSGGDDVLDQFDYKAMRYIEIIAPVSAEIKEIKMIARHYPYKESAVYPTESEKLNSILKLCADTAKYGTQETYLDCMTREKGSYLGDIAVSARAQAVITGDTTLIKKAILDTCSSARICPGLMAVSGSARMQEIADYSLLFPALLNWIYSMDGDIEFLKKTEPYATGMYKYFQRYERADGLIEDVRDKWNLVDWPKNLRDGYDFPLEKPVPKGAGPHNVMNAFWYGCITAMDELYETLGMEKTGRAEKVKASFVREFYCAETGLFADAHGSKHTAVHSSVLPLLFGIGTENEALKAKMAAHIKEKTLASMGVYMAYFALAALVTNGEYDTALELATNDNAWLNMLKEGATTTFEAWGKDQKWNTSLCHPWATAPLIIFAKGVRIY